MFLDPLNRRRALLSTLQVLTLAMLAGLGAACGSGEESAKVPTAEEAVAFLQQAETQLLDAWITEGTADWAHATDITDENEQRTAEANAAAIGLTIDLAAQATRFDAAELPAELRRRLQLVKLNLTLPAPANPAETQELPQLKAAMESIYGRGEYCDDAGDCLDLPAMTPVLAESREADRLLELWQGWRQVSVPMRETFNRYVELGNKGAQELGFADLGAMWRSKYDMDADDFALEVDRLWEQVRPLYEALHCHVRARLAETYGSDVVDPTAPIPAHLLGNMWAQQWANIYDLVAPPGGSPAYDLSELLAQKGVDELEMVRYGERFFTSLGFEPLPETFWERSLFIQPKDRDVVCHASAWDLDYEQDLRIKMCIQITAEDFNTIHHELGHNFYQRAYAHLDPLYRDSANDGFHEAVGDTVALSITPKYLVDVGLLDAEPDPSADLGLLLKMALDKVAFLPFGLLVDQWRWQVFSGEISEQDYNAGWWELRRKYQGVEAPVERSEADFDPGAKYHVPANVPYTRYFLAHILQFQFQRALCEKAGYEGPLHRCSIYGNEAAGQAMQEMLAMGMSQPWPDALEALAGSREMDASAILDYFAPLHTWLDEQNEGRTCGW